MIMLLSGDFHINRPSLRYQTEGWSLIRKIVLTSLLMEFALLVQDTEVKLSYIESKGEEQREWFGLPLFLHAWLHFAFSQH